MAGDVVLHNVRCNINGLVDTVTQPVDVQFGADDFPGSIFNSHDEYSSTGGVGPAGHFIGKFGCCCGVLGQPWQEAFQIRGRFAPGARWGVLGGLASCACWGP